MFRSKQVHFDEDSHSYDLWERGLDRRLSEPDRAWSSSQTLTENGSPNLTNLSNQCNTTVGDVVTHQFSLQNQTQFGQVNGRLRYGRIVYSTEQVPRLTCQVGAAGVVKPAFQTTGALNNSVDPQSRVIQNNWPTVAFAHNLWTVLSTKTPPIVYTVGYIRDPLVQFPNLSNVNNLRGPYYLTRFNSISDMITAFLNDYTNALACATDFDSKLFTDALDITPQVNDYANMLVLSVRQMFGNIELTSGWDGTTYVQTDIMAF
ncbi:hypothetical protein BJ322DRAFT_1102550 [Thelephora terrestris]|uniref:Glutaminase A N-terminal domain-containing protein n=1 Tax=Thelephora terrestris TaxID=56493 RepID=A0A9P6LB50_9AGAM|nr:hypothetical protein BJ322DRAFT_1102550 [Thelephora terrestris]